MKAEPGKLIGGKYRLEKPLAKGGMGSVWLARHIELDAPAAVKLMAGELLGTPAAEARFKREAKAAAQLRSPHVVHIHDYGVEEGAPFMVMELLEGHDLAGEIALHGRLPFARVAGIVAQVAKALSMAHAAGIVHRDLKPSNLFLSRSGDDEIVKVLDFGVAKETMPTLVVDRTTSGVLIGSPQYMSPEQARGEAVDLRSDLWSLGVVIYESLTGVPPFDSNHLGALLAKIGEAKPALPTSIAPDLPVEIDEFMMRALARRPEDRFASAKAMAEALRAIATTTGTGAKDPAVARPAAVVVRTVTPRSSDTLPAGAETGPVSTTMPGRAMAPDEPRGGSKRGLMAGGFVLGAVGLSVAVWLGLRSAEPASSSTFAGPDVSGSSSINAATSGAMSATVTVSPGPTAAPSSAQSPATASATATEQQAPTKESGSPVRPAPSVSARPTRAPSTSASAKPVATSPQPAPTPYDPVFGLPSKKP